MFERYTEKARRTIFFARYEASQLGSSCIETEHLLLGLLREDIGLRDRFLRSTAAVESIREQIKSRTPARKKIAYSVDLPLSHESKRVLTHGADESGRMNHKHIGTEHLLLGLLREEKSLASEILNQRGLRLSQVRNEIARTGSDNNIERTGIRMEEYLSTDYRPDCDYVDSEVQERNWGEWDHARTQKRVIFYCASREKDWGIEVLPEQRIQVGPNRFRISDVCVVLGDSEDHDIHKAPFLCIEVLSPEDRMARMKDRVDDYLNMGVPHVWVVDPQRKAAFQITPAEGWREVKDGILRTQNPSFEVPLTEIFA